MTSPRTDLAETERPSTALSPENAEGVRLLVISDDAPLFVAHHLAQTYAARCAGYEVHVATAIDSALPASDRSAVQAITRAGLSLHAFSSRKDGKRIGDHALFSGLSRLTGALNPTLIHCIGLRSVLCGGAVARMRGLAAVHAVAALGDEGEIAAQVEGGGLRRLLLVRALGFALGHRKAFLTVRSLGERAALSRLGVIAASRTFLLNGIGVDVKLFRPRPVNSPRPKGPLVALFAGPLTAAAGAREFLAIARRMRGRNKPLRFVLAGVQGLKELDAISEVELARSLAEGTVEWWRGTSDMAAVLRQVDVACAPSQGGIETLRALLQAAASGLPIVAADAPESRKLVRQGANGFLVPPQNGDALEAALTRLLSEPGLRRAAGMKSREIAVAEFSLEAVVTAALAVYRAALGRSLVEAKP